MIRHHALLLVFLAGGLLAGWFGCGQAVLSRVVLPSAYTLDLDTLVIHSDFPLPAQHRLLEELMARRQDLSQRLGLPGSGEPIHVYLFENGEQFAAFMRLYHPEFPARRAFFVETDARLAVYAQWGDRMAEDLRHEVTHGYLHAVVPGIPLWLDEGLAEWAEAPRSQAGLNRPHWELLMDARRRGQWAPDLARLESLGPSHSMSQLEYAEAWAWVHWLMESRPDVRQVLRAYLADLLQYGKGEPVSARLHRLIDRPEDQLLRHLESLGPFRPSAL